MGDLVALSMWHGVTGTGIIRRLIMSGLGELIGLQRFSQRTETFAAASMSRPPHYHKDAS